VCGRFTSTTPAEDLAAYFAVDEVAVGERAPTWNVAPTDPVLTVVERDGRRRMGEMRWGLVPFWAKDASIGSRMINARAETVTTTSAYSRPFERRRCLVAADGFYEWQPRPDRKAKQAFHIRSVDGQPLAFAGLWDSWRPTRGSDEGRVVSAAIVTTSANAVVGPIHDRMPVVLPPATWDAWLDPENDDVEALSQLLVPAADPLLEAVPVSGAVGNVRNDGPELVERVDPGELFPVS
jgi:putative SOS response-associated peptidase YedK